MQLMLNMEDMYTIYRIGAHKSTRVMAKKDCFVKPELYSSFFLLPGFVLFNKSYSNSLIKPTFTCLFAHAFVLECDR